MKNMKIRPLAMGTLAIGLPILSVILATRVTEAAPVKDGPRKTGPRNAAGALDARDKQVAAALTRVLRARFSSPGGKTNIVVRPTSRAGEGYFSEIVLSGRPAQIKKLRITELNLRARNVRIDVGALLRENKVRTLNSATGLRAVVTEDDLTYLLSRGKHTKSMGLKVKYIDGARMRVTGKLNWTLINGPVTGVGRLRMVPGYKVNLDIISLKLRGAEVPQIVKNKFSERINPVIDYDDIPFRPQIRSVRVEGSKAIIST